MRYFLSLLLASFAVQAHVAKATEPKAAALSAIKTLFVEHDLEGFRSYVAQDARQGHQAAGTAVLKLSRQKPQQVAQLGVSKIIFFQKADIDQLQQDHPDDLWSRVRENIGDHQGVLVKLALKGQLAERARAAGEDPNNIAMMTWVLNSADEPKIIHIDDN